MPKYSTKSFNEASLKEYDLKHKLMSLMSKSKSFNTHPAHKKLYDALMDSLIVDENDMDNQFVDQPTQKKPCHDDQDPPFDADKESKKRKRKDFDASPSKKIKDKEASSKEDDFADTQEPTQDDVAPKQERSKWFKQDVVERPEILILNGTKNQMQMMLLNSPGLMRW
ncbi:hypothetical protein Tco_1241292 [Tanacetum coccineum]